MSENDHPTRQWNRMDPDDSTEVIPADDPAHLDDYPDHPLETRAFSQYQPTQQSEPYSEPHRQIPEPEPIRRTGPAPHSEPDPNWDRDEVVRQHQEATKRMTKIVAVLGVGIIGVAALSAWVISRDSDPAPAAPETVQPTSQAPTPEQPQDNRGPLDGIRDRIEGLQPAPPPQQSVPRPAPEQDLPVVTTSVPDVTGLTAKEANTVLKDSGFTNVSFVDEAGKRVFLILVGDSTDAVLVDPGPGETVDPSLPVVVTVQDQVQPPA